MATFAPDAKNETTQTAPIDTAPRKRAVRGVRNPGFYEDSLAEYKKIASFECFSGGRLNLSYPIKKGSKVFMSHLKADMDASLPDRFTLDTGITIGTKADASQFSASLTNGWGTMGSFSHRINNKLSFKSDFQFTKGELINVELQRKGVDCCHSAKYSQTPKGHTFTASCMQSLTRFMSIGGRIEYEPLGSSVLSAAGRYKRMFKGPEGEKGHHGSTTTINVSSDGDWMATYTRQLDLNTHLAAELSNKASEVSASAAGLFTFQTFDFQAKVTPASGLVSCSLEHKYNPWTSVLFSGQYNQWSGESKFGLGLKVGIQ